MWSVGGWDPTSNNKDLITGFQLVFGKDLIFLIFLDGFDVLILKIKKKYYFDVFSSENNFKKQPQPHSQTPSYENWNWR